MNQASKHNQIEIRMASPVDAAAISSLLCESFAEYKPHYTDQGFAATTPNAEVVLDRLLEGPVWIALANKLIVGTASVVLKAESLYVRGMAVLPVARGQGIGELLLRRINEYAISQNCKRMFLSTTPFLDRAIRLYERFGFRRTSEGPHDLSGTPLFTMEKILGVWIRCEAAVNTSAPANVFFPGRVFVLETPELSPRKLKSINREQASNALTLYE